MSLSVPNPKLDVVLDMLSGKEVLAHKAIGNEYEPALLVRNEAMETFLAGRPRYACPFCTRGLRLNAMLASKRFYFRHAKELGDCPIDTRGRLSREEIDAIRYNGAKESALHFQMKHWIAQCIEADSGFGAPVIEGTWKGKMTGQRRRPDVNATYHGLDIAFEVQLSSTYLDVIVGRRQFYRQEGALLFWVFADFDEGMRKLTQDDVYFANNQNAFCVTRESVQASLDHGKFMLECIWRVPLSATDKSAVSDLQRRLVSFDDLVLDQERQRAYFYDFEGERAKLMDEFRAREPRPRTPLSELLDERHWTSSWNDAGVDVRPAASGRPSLDPEAEARIEPVKAPWWHSTPEAEHWRKTFKETWLRSRHQGVPAEEWEELVFRFDDHDLRLPRYPSDIPETIFKVLYSLEAGEPVGYRFDKLISVMHQTLPGNDRTAVMPYLEYVWKAVTVYGRKAELEKAPNYAAWQKKVEAHRTSAAQRVVSPAPTLQVVRLIEFIFPDLAGATATLAAKLET